MVPFSSQGEQYWGVGGWGGGLFKPPAKKFGMASITSFLPSCWKHRLYHSQDRFAPFLLQ